MKKALKTALRAWLAVFFAAVAISYLTQWTAKLFGIDLPEQAQVELVRRCAGWNWGFALLLLQVLAVVPLLEEFLFRGLAWRLPLKIARCGGYAPALALAALSSAVFSFAHYVDYRALVMNGAFVLTGWNSAFLALFFFGMAQCRLYRVTGSIWSAVLNHMLFNATNLVLLFVIPE